VQTAPRNRPAAPGRARGARGLVLLALLIMIVLVGIGALGAAELWATTLRRDREEQLLFVGDQYRRAIRSYWGMSPGRRAYPPSIAVLLTDDRFPVPVHHLRRAYRDPMTESGEFEPIVQANAIVGVHSTSTDEPMKQAGFRAPYQDFQGADMYARWQFVFLPPGARIFTPGVAPSGPIPSASPPNDVFQGPAPGAFVPQPPAGN